MRTTLIRILQALVVVAVAVSFANADDVMYVKKKAAAGGGASCSPTTGDIFTEGFENLTGSSGYESNAGTWTQTGATLDNQATLSGTPPSNSCTKGLSFNTTNAVSRSQWNKGSAIDNTKNVDYVFDIMVQTGTSLTDFTSTELLLSSATAALGSAPGIVKLTRWSPDGGSQYTIRCSDAVGTNYSTRVLLALDTWYTVTMHIDTTAANSYCKVEGGGSSTCTGTSCTFTSGAVRAVSPFSQYITLGPSDGNLGSGETLKATYGYIRVNTQ